MTMIAIGLSGELKKYKIAANTLWPKTTIATAAVRNLLGGETLINMSRTPEIIADAAYYILSKPSWNVQEIVSLTKMFWQLRELPIWINMQLTPGGKALY